MLKTKIVKGLLRADKGLIGGYYLISALLLNSGSFVVVLCVFV